MTKKTKMKTTQKIYCYVDETGQDTCGKLFIVVSIVIEKEKEILSEDLEKIEIQSGKYLRKWIKTDKIIREKYLNAVLSLNKIKNKVYFQMFKETKSYQDLMILVIAKSINRYVEQQEIRQYQATIIIDGLKKTETRKVSKALRDLGTKVHKVRGIKDESDPIIRLADALAGMVRKSKQNNQKIKNNLIIELT